MKRREFLQGLGAASVLGAVGGPVSPFSGLGEQSKSRWHSRRSNVSHKYIVLGIDGMDPKLLSRLMADGQLPNFSKLAAKGHFSPLQTTVPPQSPVAWSSFITGTDPGGHGIFDFIHRDPKTFIPYLSTSKSVAGDRVWQLGETVIPLSSGRVDLMRKGIPFWDLLAERDIPTTIFALPGNFPIVPSGDVRALSGMGTPDLLGGYGVYTLVSEVDVPGSENFSGGRVAKIQLQDHHTKFAVRGPKNPFKVKNPHTEVEFDLRRDPSNRVVKIEVQGQTVVLQEGEWSGWLPIKFELLSFLASVYGMVRIHVKKVHPYLQLYISPVQIDPMNPSMPICSPEGYSRELAEAAGRFHTMGLPADTKGLSEGALDSYEFLQQSKTVLEENLRCFDFEFSRFNDGCFVFYFSSIDQNGHMLWRCMDPKHPLYEPNAPQVVKDAIPFFYREMDKVLGRVLERLDSKTSLMVLSDHGFTDFTREIHLSSWLVDNGFTVLTRPDKRGEIDFFRYVDWKRTKAYALGINGIFLNLKGRERNGSLDPAEGQRVKDEIAAKLLNFMDPDNGAQMISRVFDTAKIYSPVHRELAPDLQVGYMPGYRISDEAILGKIPREVVRNRTNLWSADHCMDPAKVPGVLLSNQSCNTDAPGIWDMAPSILKAFGIEAPKEMTGKVVLG